MAVYEHRLLVHKDNDEILLDVAYLNCNKYIVLIKSKFSEQLKSYTKKNQWYRTIQLKVYKNERSVMSKNNVTTKYASTLKL